MLTHVAAPAFVRSRGAVPQMPSLGSQEGLTEWKSLYPDCDRLLFLVS